jgi:hypothetical protein
MIAVNSDVGGNEELENSVTTSNMGDTRNLRRGEDREEVGEDAISK